MGKDNQSLGFSFFKFIFLDPNQQQGSKHNSALIGLIEVSLFIQRQNPTGLNM